MSLAGDVQGLVDALAAELGRPAGLDDHRFRSIAYSSHLDVVDEVRAASILRRVAPPGVVGWLESLGVRELDSAGRVAANESLGLAARVCVPVRFEGILLGFLWLIDEPTRLSDSQVGLAVTYSEEIAVAIYRDRLLDRDIDERERVLLERALAKAGGDSHAAAAELIAGGQLSAAPSYSALVLRVANGGGHPASDAIRVRMADAAERLRRTMPPHHLLTLASADEVIVVLALGSAAEGERRADALAAATERVLSEHRDWKATVGVGEPVEDAGALLDSYRQASLAAWVSEALGCRRPVSSWRELGAERTIAAFVRDGGAPADPPESLRRLLADEDARILLATLERYLDLGGDVRAAAADLYIHRSSLYGRLHRIERIAEVDLHSGEDRLELHLGIRILRLRGELHYDTTDVARCPIDDSGRSQPHSMARKPL
jgi:hypothetical protein